MKNESRLGCAIGFLWGLVACAIIECCSSCARKISVDEEEIVKSGLTNIKTDSTYLNVDTNVTENVTSATDSWWNSVVTKKYYAYDSIGNQSLVSEEIAVSSGGTQKRDSSNVVSNSNMELTNVVTEFIHDTLYVDKKENVYIDNGIPFYWKILAYTGIFFLTILVLYIIYYITRRSILH